MSKCSVVTCDRESGETGLCLTHRARQRSGKSLDSPIRDRASKPIADRFWPKVDKSGECWLWTALLDRAGYGRFRMGNQMRLAPRVAWEMEEGEIPEGMEIDHLCHNPACVNTGHLATVTRRQNTQNISGPHKRSKTGVRGVYPSGNRFRVSVHVDGKPVHVGSFPTLAEAEAAAIEARENAGYHSERAAKEKMRDV